MPRISVLLPVYNGEKFLANAVRSILWQTWQDWELLIIDDGSTDSSLSYAQHFAAQDRRLRIISRPHRGLVETLNEGLQLCKAPLIARMDSDDIAAPQRLERQWQYLETHPEIAAMGSRIRIFPGKNRSLGIRRYERWLNRYCESEDLARDIFVESPLVHPSVMFRRADILELGGYRQCPWPEDYDLWMRMWQRQLRFAKTSEVLLYWRDTPQRLTHTDARCQHNSLRSLKIFYLIHTFFPECCPGRQAKLHRPVLVWGAGSNGRDLVKSLRQHGLFPHGWVDNSPSRQGQHILGLPVMSADQVLLRGHEFIIMAVSNPYVRADVRKRLDALGAQEGRDYICLANIAKR
ncbi:MAG: glycosyltransferase [bacterium]|nr:glycosyltransferase [bacterium]